MAMSRAVLAGHGLKVSSQTSIRCLASGATDSRKDLIGPSVRNLLHQYGINSSDVASTGPHNVLLKGDVLNFIKSNNISPLSPEEQSKPSASRAAAGPSRSGTRRGPRRTSGPAPFVDIELTNMRKVIAKRLTESKSTIPHSYLTADTNITQLIRVRQEMKNRGINVSVNDYIIKAVGLALQQNPAVNVRFSEEAIEAVPSIDISIAVATPNGLITPIVKNANRLPVQEISSTVRELADRAKQGKLQPHEFQGGSFSISNLGMFGITEFSAVINPPQSAILAIGGGRQVVTTDNRVETRMTVTMSYDARSIDEEAVARFMETFSQLLADPSLMDGGRDQRRLNALVN